MKQWVETVVGWFGKQGPSAAGEAGQALAGRAAHKQSRDAR